MRPRRGRQAILIGSLSRFPAVWRLARLPSHAVLLGGIWRYRAEGAWCHLFVVPEEAILSPEWISALANLMTGLAAVVAGWAGVRGLDAWRAELVGQRKTELAEEVLAGFYRVRDILTWARFPASDDNDDGEDDRPGAGPG